MQACPTSHPPTQYVPYKGGELRGTYFNPTLSCKGDFSPNLLRLLYTPRRMQRSQSYKLSLLNGDMQILDLWKQCLSNMKNCLHSPCLFQAAGIREFE